MATPTTAELLKRARQSRRLTRQELSMLSGVSTSTISRIEADQVRPSYDNMRLLLRTLGYESSDQLRPQVTTEQLARVSAELANGQIGRSESSQWLRIAAQVSPILQRPGARRVAATLSELIEWAQARGAEYAVSGLEACSNQGSLIPILYVSEGADLPFPAPAWGRMGSVILPLTHELDSFLIDESGTMFLTETWAMMDAIASPDRQSDVALEILESYDRRAAA